MRSEPKQLHMLQRFLCQMGEPRVRQKRCDMKKSLNVDCLRYLTNAYFSQGLRCLVDEYPVTIGDTCYFKLIKSIELQLVVSKPTTHIKKRVNCLWLDKDEDQEGQQLKKDCRNKKNNKKLEHVKKKKTSV